MIIIYLVIEVNFLFGVHSIVAQLSEMSDKMFVEGCGKVFDEKKSLSEYSQIHVIKRSQMKNPRNKEQSKKLKDIMKAMEIKLMLHEHKLVNICIKLTRLNQEYIGKVLGKCNKVSKSFKRNFFSIVSINNSILIIDKDERATGKGDDDLNSNINAKLSSISTLEEVLVIPDAEAECVDCDFYQTEKYQPNDRSLSSSDDSYQDINDYQFVSEMNYMESEIFF